MIDTLLILVIFAASVAALSHTERAAGTMTATAALITGAVLACTEAGLLMSSSCWLLGVALALTMLNYLLGRKRADVDNNRAEVR